MDVSKYLDLRIAPRAIFDALDERRDRVRFQVPVPSATPLPPGTAPEYRPVTYGEFAAEIREMACFLASLLATGDRAAIFAPNRVEWASAALAIQAAGGAIVPVYPASMPPQAGYVIGHSDAKVLFVDTPALLGKIFETWDALADVRKVVLLDDGLDPLRVAQKLRETKQGIPDDAAITERTIHWSKARAQGREADAENPGAFRERMNAVPLDAVGMMLYTSGTSGNPKGVPLTHRNVGVNGRDWLQANGPLMNENAIDILWLPMSHIFGFGQMGLGNTLGFTTYLADPASCLSLLPVLEPSVFMSVPSHWEKLAGMAGGDPKKLLEITGGKLTFCLSGGAGLKREVKEAFHAAGLLIIEGYGLTETSPTLTMNRPDAFRFDTVGRPFPSVQVKLAEDGEILAKGENVFGGYHKDEAATREAFTEDGWFKTGDVGRFTEDGFLQIVDRKKDILVTAGGKNVAPQNVELRFMGDPHFSHVVVYGDGKKYLVAGVWLTDALLPPDVAQDPEKKRALVQAKVDEVNAGLASFETIKTFAIIEQPLTVESELLTASFKVRRKKVYQTFKDTFEALYEVKRA